jgi:CarboxypepD_reg-like domain
MKVKYLLILFLNITIAHAQQIHLKGSIVDAQSGLPIPNATVSVPYKNLFYPTNNEGKYDISDDKIAQTDSIGISCIGYKTQTVRVNNLEPGGTIKLALLVKALQGVKIGINPPALTKCGSKMTSKALWSSWIPLMEAARFMSGSRNKKGIIQSVGFYLGDGGIFDANKGGDVTAPFRVRLYGVDTGGAPGKELTKDVIIVSAKKNNVW